MELEYLASIGLQSLTCAPTLLARAGSTNPDGGPVIEAALCIIPPPAIWSAIQAIREIHHKAFAPLPIEYIYVHPLEWIVGAIGPFLGLLVLHLAWGAIPAWSLWAYLLVRNLHELDVHSGIKSPLGKWIPLYAPAEHHDLHHAKPTKGNFASTLTFWDNVLGTYWRP